MKMGYSDASETELTSESREKFLKKKNIKRTFKMKNEMK